MEKQFKDLLDLYKDFKDIFNNWETTRNDDIDFSNFQLLVNVWRNLTDLLVSNNIIKPYGLKHYEIIETGEII